jgi:DNA-directed RNA polymerase specialized sigma24 family protein
MSRELELLAKKHQKWIKMICSFGCNKDYAEDYVQDAYIKLDEYLKKGVNVDYGNNDVNEFYFYMILRSIYYNSQKKKGLEIFETSSDDHLSYVLNKLKAEFEDVEMESAYTRLINKIFKEINAWNFYDRNVFIAYFTTSLSLDKLSNDTLIGRSSLYNTIRRYRDVIRDKFVEDAEDFFHGDYHHIK